MTSFKFYFIYIACPLFLLWLPPVLVRPLMNVCFGTRVRGYLQVHVVRLPLATSLLHLYSTKALSTETSKTTKKDGSRFRLSHLLRRQRVTTLESLDHVRTKRSRSRKDVLSLLSNFASPENEHPPAFLPPKKLYSALLSERAKKRSKSVPSKSVPSKSQQEELSTFVTGWGKDGTLCLIFYFLSLSSLTFRIEASERGEHTRNRSIYLVTKLLR